MCGFVGIVGVEPVAPNLALGLSAIQHRGQDAAGIAVYSDGYVKVHKDLGMVSKVLPRHIIENMRGTSGVGHVRYPTLGGSTRADAQPFMTRRPSIGLCHNGNITNLQELEAGLVERGIRMMSQCDSEPILLVLGDELLRIRVVDYTTEDLVEALEQVLARLRGSYSVAAVMDVDGRESLVAFRDPMGIRPAVYGRRADGAWMVASESVSLDVLDFEFVDHVPPGGLVIMRKGEEPVIRSVAPLPLKHCIFEDIYFARPDSRMEGGRILTRRRAFGQALAQQWTAKGLHADVVVPVPDTSRPAAQAMAEELGVPNREGFIKNRYSGRTFIMPDQASREAAMRLKLNPIDEIFRDKRVVLVDDSIVRGTTMRRIVQMCRRHEPAELHVAIYSPPVRNPCYYGIDMPSREELVAGDVPAEEVELRLAERFGADSVTFLDLQRLAQVGGKSVCDACFTGRYPIPLNEDERAFIIQQRRA